MKNFVVYNSSAGSGKTYTLVKEYLKIALGQESSLAYKNILAVTFTNKAAAEMKERVVAALKALAKGGVLEGTPLFLQEDLLKPLAEGGLGITPEQLQERSARVLKSILHHYNDFGISTIDKFTHKIVRTFAHDLQLPLNFDIALDASEILSNAIDLLIAQVGVDEDLTKLLLAYTKKKAESEENWHIEKELFQFAKNLLRDDGELYLQKIRTKDSTDFDRVKAKLHHQSQLFEAKVQEMATVVLQYVRDHGIAEESFYRSFYPKYWKDLKKLKKLEPVPSLEKIVDGEIPWYGAKVEEDQKQLIDTHHTYFWEAYQASREFIDAEGSDYYIGKLLLQNIHALAVLNEIEKTVATLKQENNVLNINDFNKKIAQIIANEPVPFIYERLGERYDHYLIDEFQDTSVMQWHNLIPLVDNALAKGKLNLVVGDAKQAIYRFRGGEVEQILQLPQLYKHQDNALLLEREQALVRNYQHKELQQNFRSKAEVVQFNNQFFSFIAAKLSERYRPLYQNLEQQFNAERTGGGVQIDFIPVSNKELLTEQTFNKVLELIDKNRTDGYALSDMAILTRSNADGSALANCLIENGVPVISSESLLLSGSDEVKFLMHLIRFLALYDQKNAEVQALQYIIKQLFPTSDLLEVLKRYPKDTLRRFLNEKGMAMDTIRIESGSLYELCEYLSEHFGLNEGLNIYVQFFLDKVQEYVTRHDNVLLNFIEWWEAKNANFSIVVPEGVDAVQVMSIHKAKGLEFPVVIYPFATVTVKTNENYFWTSATAQFGLETALLPIRKELEKTAFSAVYEEEMDKSTLDLMNILYVALTRPKDRLYILSDYNESKKSGKRTPSKNGSVSDYLWDFCATQPDHQVSEHQFVFGAFEVPEVKHKPALDQKQMASTIYTNWRKKIKISYQAPEMWDVSNPTSIGEHGTLLHQLLARIENVDDLDEVLTTSLREGLFTVEEQTSIRTELAALFELDEVKELFLGRNTVKNEASILLPDGSSYQPDKVVFQENKTVVVDYKTGKKENHHQKQVSHYRQLLLEMGYVNVEAYLLYTSERELVKV